VIDSRDVPSLERLSPLADAWVMENSLEKTRAPVYNLFPNGLYRAFIPILAGWRQRNNGAFLDSSHCARDIRRGVSQTYEEVLLVTESA